MAYSPENNPYIPGDPYSYDLKWLVDKVKNLNLSSERLDDAIEIAETSADTASAAAATAQQAAAMLQGKRYILIGDSYLEGYSSDGMYTDWGTYLKQMRNIADGDIFVGRMGGTGFCATNSDVNFLTLLQNITVTNPETITDIIACGGLNDGGYSNEQIFNAISGFCTIARTRFPNARINIGMISNDYRDDTGTISYRNRLSKVYDCYNKCAAYGAHYLSGVENAVAPNALASDLYHPNGNGQYAIAIAISNALEGSFEAFGTATATIKSVGGANIGNIYSVLTGGMVTAKIGLYNFNISGITFTGSPSDFHTIATFDKQNSYLFPNGASVLDIPFNCVIGISGGFRSVHGILRLKGNEIQMSIMAITDAGNNYQAYTPTQIQCNCFLQTSVSYIRQM